MKWLNDVIQYEKLAYLGNGKRESVLGLKCPRCSIVQQQYMILDDNNKGNVIPKYCCYCGKKLVEESKNESNNY